MWTKNRQCTVQQLHLDHSQLCSWSVQLHCQLVSHFRCHLLHALEKWTQMFPLCQKQTTLHFSKFRMKHYITWPWALHVPKDSTAFLVTLNKLILDQHLTNPQEPTHDKARAYTVVRLQKSGRFSNVNKKPISGAIMTGKILLSTETTSKNK